MGIFHDMVTIINLAPVPLTITFDGQTQRIPVGESQVPKQVVPYAKNQNPIMGSADAENPNISGARYLISVKGSKDRQTPLTEDEWTEHLGKPSRVNVEEFIESNLGKRETLQVRGKGRKVQAKSSFDAGVRVNSPETFANAGD